MLPRPWQAGKNRTRAQPGMASAKKKPRLHLPLPRRRIPHQRRLDGYLGTVLGAVLAGSKGTLLTPPRDRFPRERIMPDGLVELVFHFAEPLRTIRADGTAQRLYDKWFAAREADAAEGAP